MVVLVPATGVYGLLSEENSMWYRRAIEENRLEEHEEHEEGPPDWWHGPSSNVFARDMTEAEVVLEWLKNRQVEQEGDRYVFYHGTPNPDLTYLRGGSLLESDPSEAAKWGSEAKDYTEYKGIKPSDMIVHRLALKPWQIHTGFWASLRDDYPLPGKD